MIQIYFDFEIKIIFDKKTNYFYIYDIKDILIDKVYLFDDTNSNYIIIEIIKDKITTNCKYCNKLIKITKNEFCNRKCSYLYKSALRKHQHIILDEKIIALKERMERCEYCKIKFNDINIKNADHILPLSEYKHNNYDNIAIVCQKCNSSKKNKDLLCWAELKGLDLPKHIISHYYWLKKNI